MAGRGAESAPGDLGASGRPQAASTSPPRRKPAMSRILSTLVLLVEPVQLRSVSPEHLLARFRGHINEASRDLVLGARPGRVCQWHVCGPHDVFGADVRF